MKQVAIFAILAAAALLSACGSSGSGDDDVAPPPAANEVPAAALASASAYTNYTKTLSDKNDEPPVGVNNVSTAPASETEAPLAM
jgi:outer membrane lipopolysaccharide assembly protein LptE/RlpB